jgi:hypothetical protein
MVIEFQALLTIIIVDLTFLLREVERDFVKLRTINIYTKIIFVLLFNKNHHKWEKHAYL